VREKIRYIILEQNTNHFRIFLALSLRNSYASPKRKRIQIMAHDGQITEGRSAMLDDLLTLTAAAVAPVEAILAKATNTVRTMVSDAGRVSNTLVEQHQTAAHGLAWLATYAQSLRQMQSWAEKLQSEGKFSETEALIHQIAFGEYPSQINNA